MGSILLCFKSVPSIFRQKMELTRPMMKKILCKGIFFPPKLAYQFGCLLTKVLFLFVPWRVNKIHSRPEKFIKRNEKKSLDNFCSLDFYQSPFIFATTLLKPVFELKLQIKINQFFNFSFFPLLKTATLSKKEKLAATIRKNHEEHP